MPDTFDPKAGIEKTMATMSEASKSMQTFAAEVTRMSKENMEHTSALMEKLRGAKSMEDIVALQTSYMQQSFASYTDYTRRVSELMMKLPMEMMKQSQGAIQQGTDALRKTAETAGEQIKQAGEQFKQH
jgi:phasin family protein